VTQTPPHSALLLRALAVTPPDLQVVGAETLLAASLGWSYSHLTELLEAGVNAGYITSAMVGRVALTEKGRAWCAKHSND